MRSRSCTDHLSAYISVALVILAIAFQYTPGFLASVGPAKEKIYSRDYQSTGSDDDVCVNGGAFLFGVFLFISLPWRSYKLTACLKAVIFFFFWLAQLLLLNWIEVGSIQLTIFEDHNGVLAAYLVIFYLAAPAIITALFLDLRAR